MSSRWSSSGVAVPVRAVAWLPLDAPPWSVLQDIARVSGPVMAPATYAPPTVGVLAVPSRPERPLASSRPEPRRHGPVLHPLQAIAGITPIPAGPRVSGTSARKPGPNGFPAGIAIG